MEQSDIRGNRWNVAARYGLIFGVISAAYLYYGHLQIALGWGGLFSGFVGFVIWIAKFVGCIMLMKHVMTKFVIDNPEATNSDVFKLGALIATLSALVYAVVNVADQLYVFPEYYQEIYAVMITEYSKILPSQQVEEIKVILAGAPKIAFIGNFIYCALYGTILSLILSRNIPSRNPFNNYTPDQQ